MRKHHHFASAVAIAALLPMSLSAAYVPGSLVAHWPMDETDTNVKTLEDTSGNNNTGIFTEGPAVLGFQTGSGGNFTTTGPTINSVTKNAFEFDGNDDLLIVPDSAAFDSAATQGSISFWINTDLDARMSILRGRNTADDNYTGPALEKTGSSGSAAYRVFFNPNVAEAAYFMAEALPTNNVWQHYVFVWDYSASDSGNAANPNRVKCYVNGVLTTNRTSSGGSGDSGFTTPPTWGELIFGGRYSLTDASAGTYRAFDGEMGEIAIYNTALDATAAANLYNNGVNPGASDLIGYWDFSEGSGATVADDSTNDNTMQVANWEPTLPVATVGNGPTFAAANSTNKPSYISQALEFDGTSDAIRVPDSTSLDFNKGQGSIVFWAYFDSNARTNIIGDTSGGIIGQISSSLRMAFKAANSSDFLQTTAAGTTVPAGEWVHYAYVFDQSQSAGTTAAPNRVKIYRNGVALANGTTNLDTTFTTIGTTADWIIGRKENITDVTNARWLNGQLADMAIFSAPLSASDIADIVANGVTAFLPTPESPTVTTNAGLTLGRAATAQITSAALAATDSLEGASSLTYTVTTAPTRGVLSSNTFTQADINGGTVTYTSTGTAGADSFEFSLSDGTAAAPVTGTFAITVTPSVDTDRDGIPDAVETTIGTQANNKDSDNDTIEDGVERAIGTNPNSDTDPIVGNRTDTDGDGIPDAYDSAPSNADSDSDGYRDGYEYAYNGTTTLAGTPPLGDANGDTLKNAADATLILEAFLEVSTLAVDDEQVDINRDGIVDNVDAVLLYQWALTNISAIPFPK
ncbi:hypothetical protein GC173_11170 [bacterium]|nr:hypothetical protein [bacterium]